MNIFSLYLQLETRAPWPSETATMLKMINATLLERSLVSDAIRQSSVNANVRGLEATEPAMLQVLLSITQPPSSPQISSAHGDTAILSHMPPESPWHIPATPPNRPPILAPGKPIAYGLRAFKIEINDASWQLFRSLELQYSRTLAATWADGLTERINEGVFDLS